MGQVIGELLPLALGVAISPVPIISVILMLFAPRAGGTSFGFLLGWLVGIIVATAVFVWLAAAMGVGDSDGTSSSAWLRIGLGVLLLSLAGRQWRSRPAPGTDAKLPGWMTAIDRFTPAKAFGLGFGLSAINPKNLVMCAGAGIAIGAVALSGGQQVIAVAVFTLIAGCTVLIPVIVYAAAADRVRGPLDKFKVWLQNNNATVMFVLLLVLGVVLIGKGIGDLG